MKTLSDCVFDWMQHDFAARLGVCEREIRRETPLSRFLPSERRREFWQTQERQLGVQFPRLELPLPLQRRGNWLAGGSALRTLLWALLLGAKWFALPLGVGAGAVAWLLYRWLTLPWATERPDLETFGDLARLLLAGNMKTLRQRFGVPPNREEIFATVVALLADVAGVDPREITSETKLDELFGC